MGALEDAAAEKLEAANNSTEPPKPRRGRPPGSKNKPKSGPQPTGTSKPENGDKETFVYIADPGSIAASTLLGATVWGLLALTTKKFRTLTDEEANELGIALDPVLCRWVPIFGDWKHELGLVMVIGTLVAATKIEDKAPNKEASSAEIVDASTS